MEGQDLHTRYEDFKARLQDALSRIPEEEWRAYAEKRFNAFLKDVIEDSIEPALSDRGTPDHTYMLSEEELSKLTSSLSPESFVIKDSLDIYLERAIQEIIGKEVKPNFPVIEGSAEAKFSEVISVEATPDNSDKVEVLNGEILEPAAEEEHVENSDSGPITIDAVARNITPEDIEIGVEAFGLDGDSSTGYSTPYLPVIQDATGNCNACTGGAPPAPPGGDDPEQQNPEREPERTDTVFSRHFVETMSLQQFLAELKNYANLQSRQKTAAQKRVKSATSYYQTLETFWGEHLYAPLIMREILRDQASRLTVTPGKNENGVDALTFKTVKEDPPYSFESNVHKTVFKGDNGNFGPQAAMDLIVASYINGNFETGLIKLNGSKEHMYYMTQAVHELNKILPPNQQLQIENPVNEPPRTKYGLGKPVADKNWEAFAEKYDIRKKLPKKEFFMESEKNEALLEFFGGDKLLTQAARWIHENQSVRIDKLADALDISFEETRAIREQLLDLGVLTQSQELKKLDKDSKNQLQVTTYESAVDENGKPNNYTSLNTIFYAAALRGVHVRELQNDIIAKDNEVFDKIGHRKGRWEMIKEFADQTSPIEHKTKTRKRHTKGSDDTATAGAGAGAAGGQNGAQATLEMGSPA